MMRFVNNNSGIRAASLQDHNDDRFTSERTFHMRSAFSLAACAVLGLVALGASAPRAAQAQATHVYDLNNTYADALGGASLAPNGGTLGATGYTFDRGQGLTLENSINASNYSIEMLFQFNEIGGYKRVLDFKNRIGDQGLYLNNGFLTFYFGSGIQSQVGTTLVSTFTPVSVVVTRDSATSLFTGYVNGVQEFAFTDSTSLGVFSAPNTIAHFFQDNLTGGATGENPSGFADRIRIYDTALSAQQVAGLGAPTATAAPEPGTIALALTSGLPVVGVVCRRRKK